VVLFDEIEKAHDDVWNVLLQVLDDGRLTDGQGNVVDFKNTVVILTSNLGTAAAAEIEQKKDLDEETKRDLIEMAVLEEVKRRMRPEFLNRLDEQVVFHRLEKKHMRGIVDIQLARFIERLHERDIAATVTNAAKDLVIEAGWDPQYGARPLKRAITHMISNELAKRLLAGEFVSGDHLEVGGANGAITFTKTPAA
jgi:ATP-dependent Clp protease ATP-binding subunit ClpB